MRAISDWRAKGVPTEPLAWLIRVARNTLISHCRRVRPQLVEPALLNLIVGEPSLATDDPGTASVINWGRLPARASLTGVAPSLPIEAMR